VKAQGHSEGAEVKAQGHTHYAQGHTHCQEGAGTHSIKIMKVLTEPAVVPDGVLEGYEDVEIKYHMSMELELYDAQDKLIHSFQINSQQGGPHAFVAKMALPKPENGEVHGSRLKDQQGPPDAMEDNIKINLINALVKEVQDNQIIFQRGVEGLYQQQTTKTLPAGWKYKIKQLNWVVQPTKHKYTLKLKSDQSKEWGTWEIKMLIKIIFDYDPKAVDQLGRLKHKTPFLKYSRR